MSDSEGEWGPEEVAAAFVDCARYGELETLIAAIKEDPSLVKNARDGNGNSAFHTAAANNQIGCLRILLNRGKTECGGEKTEFVQNYVDVENDNGNTPLHWAALNDAVECVCLLLENGADPMRKNRQRKTPLDLAMSRNAEKSENAILKALPENETTDTLDVVENGIHVSELGDDENIIVDSVNEIDDEPMDEN